MKKDKLCESCTLNKEPFVPPEGDPRKARLVLIGEAPGRVEVEQGKPFVGKSGKLLRSILEGLLKEFNVGFDCVYITNVVKCRPPLNRAPTEEEIKKCSRFLESELSQLPRSAVIVCLGDTAKSWFRIGYSLSEVRGFFRESKYGWVIPTYHPANRRLYHVDLCGMSGLKALVLDLGRAIKLSLTGEKGKYAPYKLVDNWEDAQLLLNEVGSEVVLDFETTGLDMFSKGFRVLCIGLAVNDKNYIIPAEWDKTPELFKEIWNKVKRVVVFNATFDIPVACTAYNLSLDGKEIEDLQVIYYLLKGGRIAGLSLKRLAIDYTSYGDYGLGDRMKEISKLERCTLYPYCATDVAVTSQTYKHLKDMLLRTKLEWSWLFGERDMTLYDAYEKVLKKAVPFVVQLKLNGIKVDVEYLLSLETQIKEKMAQIQTEAERMLKKKVNLNSPQQVLQTLRERGHKIDSTKSEVLEYLESRDQFVKLLLDYRTLSKLYRTYVVNLVESSLGSCDGLIHSTFSLVNTASGRLASYNPNLQNIPVRFGDMIEKAFVSSFGDEGLMIKSDFSQHELRVAALYSKDERMVNYFKENKDLHREVAIRIYGLKEEDFGTEREKELRRYAKGFNFGVIYGRSGISIARELGISEEEAERVIKDYFELFSGLKRWIDGVKDFVKSNGYVRSMFGRVRFLGDEEGKDDRGFIERAAVNTPIQSAASDIALLCAVEISKRMKEMGLSSKVVNFIHDAVLIDTYAPEKDLILGIIKDVVEGIEVPVEKPFNFEVEVSCGRSWGDCKK